MDIKIISCGNNFFKVELTNSPIAVCNSILKNPINSYFYDIAKTYKKLFIDLQNQFDVDEDGDIIDQHFELTQRFIEDICGAIQFNQ